MPKCDNKVKKGDFECSGALGASDTNALNQELLSYVIIQERERERERELYGANLTEPLVWDIIGTTDTRQCYDTWSTTDILLNTTNLV